MHAEQDCIALELIYSGGAGQQTMAGLSVCVYVAAAAEPEQKQHLIMIMNYEVVRLIKTSFHSPAELWLSNKRY